MSVDNTTPGLHLPLPDAGNALEVDVVRLIAALTGLDSAWTEIQAALGNKQPKSINLDKLAAVALTASKVFTTDSAGDPALVPLANFVRDSILPAADAASLRTALQLTSSAIATIQANKNDATPGALQTVGAFEGPDHADSRFFKVDSPANTDWNLIVQKGLHKSILNSAGTNGPGGTGYYYCIVYHSYDGVSLTQVAYPASPATGTRIWTRYRASTSAWQPWQKSLGTADLVIASALQSGFMTSAQFNKIEALGNMGNRNLTVSTSDPTGGVDGDIHFKLES